jgi:hypothetical protein
MEYPIILFPSEKPTFQFSVSTAKKNKKTGASELVAFSHVLELGLECIREDISIVIEGHRYEPDLVYINKEKNIFVDIEIDEPYSGAHHPTHYITSKGAHKDTRRNEMFRQAGWFVVRFTERQMFCETKSCMKVLFDLLLKVNAIESISACLLNVNELKLEPCWTAEESKHKSHQCYRKTYLGYNPIKIDFSSYVRCCMLIVPIILQSFRNKRIRKMMLKQLRGFFFH